MQTSNKTGSKVKKMVICASLSALMLGLSGCGGSQNANKDTSEGTTTVQQTSSETGTNSQDNGTGSKSESGAYHSTDGWSVQYNADLIEVSEVDGHTVSFVYTGDSAGTNMVSIQYIPDQQPAEALYDLTSEWGDMEAFIRSEGFFPGTEDKWGYWRTYSSQEGLALTAIAGEYNGGVLLFDLTNHTGDDEGQNMSVSDTLERVIDSITYDNFENQTMYSYIPGTYVKEKDDASGYMDTIILNADHTGSMDFQDTVDIEWGSIIRMMDGSEYEYHIEGDNLYLIMDDYTYEFMREGSSASSDDTQNPVMNFIGEYAWGRALMTVGASGSTGATVKVTWGSSYNEQAEWTMSGEGIVEDEKQLVIHYTDCQKKVVVYNEDGSVDLETVEYEDGKGTITITYEGSVVTWEDEQEHIADDAEFTWAR
ncbi:MAG: hypothetical protein IJ648_00260 [Lachnospiraceae bacterium]|nr:hypothetical protein [Lachnospiraceae bacterium]MBR1856881.1 hypothetical protein [Oribacterium sp.]